MTPNEKLLRELYAAITAGQDATAYFHPDAEQIEFPSLMRPHGHRRGLAEMREGAVRGAQILREQHYDVHNYLGQGNQAAVQLTWTATTATDLGDLAEGSTLTAHVAAFYEFRDGLVLRQGSYDCYEPVTPRPGPERAAP